MLGFLSKFVAEAVEEMSMQQVEAVRATGAPFLSLVRESAVLGLVGGGGLGMALDTALANLYWDQAGVVLFVIFVVVIITEIVTAWIRGKIF
jgi:phosphonate transport system permease protein